MYCTDFKECAKRTLIRFRFRCSEAVSELSNILYDTSMRMTRLILAVSSIMWGVLLLDDAVLFTNTRTTYLIMRSIMHEDVWGWLFLICGITSLYSLLFKVNNAFTVIFDVLLSAMLWTISTLACFLAHWPISATGGWFNQWHIYVPPAAMSGEFWLSIAAWWQIVRKLIDRPRYPACTED